MKIIETVVYEDDYCGCCELFYAASDLLIVYVEEDDVEIVICRGCI